MGTTSHVVVIGGGFGGLAAACTAAARGHKVELFEKTGKIGGRIVPGSVPAVKFDIKNYLSWLENELKTAEKTGGLKLRLNTEATPESIRGGKFDAAVVAVGTKLLSLNLPGSADVKMEQAVDVLNDAGRLGDAKKIVVVGGGVVGCEMAQWLAYEKGLDVTVVEMLPHFMEGACTANRGHLLYALHEAGVKLLNCAKVTGFAAGAVNISRNRHKNVPDPYNSWSPILPENIENPLAPKLGEEYADETLAADLVIIAAGGKADDALYFDMLKARAAEELYPIGDSFAPGKVQEAVRAAYRLGTTI